MEKKLTRLSIYITSMLCCIMLPAMLHAQVGVWPGDVDNNGIVNNADLLYLGRAYGYQGPARTSTSMVFVEQQAGAWNFVLPNSLSLNAAHADGDGNGMVDRDDTMAIVQNYGLTHGTFRTDSVPVANDETPALFFANDDLNISGGTPVDLHVTLGTPSFPVDSFFGVAFSWHYDTTIVKKNSVVATLDTRWIINATNISAGELLFFQKNIPDSGRIDIAISQRYNYGSASLARNISGYGNVAMISMVIEDNLIGKTSGIYKLGIGPSQVSMLDVNLNSYAVKLIQDTLNIDAYTGVNITDESDATIKIYPNPATDEVTIGMGSKLAKTVTLFDVTGRTMMEKTPSTSGTVLLNIQPVPSGLYLVRIITNDGIITKKLWKK